MTADRPDRIPMLDLAAHHAPLEADLRAAFARVLGHGGFVLGAEVRSLEKALEETLGFGHAIGVSSGTDALLLALMALEIGPGDEVITTPLSFFATAGAIHRVGARPVFVDVDPDSLNLDPSRVEAALTPRTRAILPVHLYGRPADMQALCEIADRHGVAVVEDAAQALGARTLAGRAIGTLGRAGCFSFFPTKNLGALGDAGLVTCEDRALAERLRTLRSHGARPKYFHAHVGGNFRLDALQAALLAVKLPHLAVWTEARRQRAARYEDWLAPGGIAPAGLTLPERVPGHVFHHYTVRCVSRDSVRARLAERGIDAEVYYPRPLHLQACFAHLGYREGDLPEAERASDEVLSLPVYPELGEAAQRRVAEGLLEAIAKEGA